MSFKKISIGLMLSALFFISVFFVWGFSNEEGTGAIEEVTNEQDENNNENVTEEDSEMVEEDQAEDQPDEPTDEESEEQAEDEDQNEDEADPVVHEGEFELPIEGAAGYTSIEMPLYASPNDEADVQTVLSSGSEFEILSEDGEWWKVQTSEITGWLQHKFAFINLPDIIPSIVYDNTNSYNSIFTSSNHDIPHLTNQALYQAIDYNERLEEESFVMPILYETAKKVNTAQQQALEHGEALKIYETYRPYETQQQVVDSLSNLAQENQEVWNGLNRGSWSQGWFIITGEVSNHQIGAAMDVSLVSVDEMEETVVGDYLVSEITEYTELEMQTTMHELSADSVIFQNTVPNDSKTAWQNQPLADAMTDPAKRLQDYATGAGFTPIASEWWHFNDLDAVESLGDLSGTGDFHITQTRNSQPEHDTNEDNI